MRRAMIERFRRMKQLADELGELGDVDTLILGTAVWTDEPVAIEAWEPKQQVESVDLFHAILETQLMIDALLNVLENEGKTALGSVPTDTP